MKNRSGLLFYRVRVWLIGAMVFSGTPLCAQNGVSLVTSLNVPHGGPSPSYGFYFASCWGYAAPDGHEYALIGCYSGTSIIDLDTNPIREVGYIPGANSSWKEIKTWGHYAYVVSEGQQGIQIINLSQLPDTAWLVGAVSSVGGRNVSRNHTVTVADGYLYLNGSAFNGPGGTIILSLANPENPTYVGEYQPEYLHDCYVRNDTLYGAAINGPPNGGVYIASLANKAVPQQIGHITYAGSGTHNTWASVDGRYVFTTDEVGSTQKNMKVFNISNLPAFTPLTPFDFNPAAIIHNIHGRGNYIYVDHYSAGVFVADVHNPSAIINSGTYDTYNGSGSGYIGCWGVYPYFPSGRWIASDKQTGLYVLRFSGLLPRIRSSLIAPAYGDTITQAAPTTFRWGMAASQSEDPHYYALHILGPGVDTLLKTRDTVLAVTALPGFQNGQRYSWHVWIKDEFTSVSSRDTFQFVYKGAGIGPPPGPSGPKDFCLFQNYPNPFNPVTTISYDIAAPAHVTLRVFNVIGEQVAEMVNADLPAGHYMATFDVSGPTPKKSKLASGVYTYALSAGTFTDVKKMLLLR